MPPQVIVITYTSTGDLFPHGIIPLCVSPFAERKTRRLPNDLMKELVFKGSLGRLPKPTESAGTPTGSVECLSGLGIEPVSPRIACELSTKLKLFKRYI